jgi:hypothetical protein
MEDGSEELKDRRWRNGLLEALYIAQDPLQFLIEMGGLGWFLAFLLVTIVAN